MKCHFNKPLSASDVVLMPLYKRVFAKFIYEPRVKKLLQGVVDRDEVMETAEWFESVDTIQLSKKIPILNSTDSAMNQ